METLIEEKEKAQFERLDLEIAESKYLADKDISMKCNGCSSKTKFETFKLGRGVTQEWHEHEDTGELVIINTWWVQSGPEDADQEFEVIKVFPRTACELAKINKGVHNKPIL